MSKRRRSVAAMTEVEMLKHQVRDLQNQVKALRQSGPSTIQSDRLLDVADPVHGQLIMNYPGSFTDADETDPIAFYHKGDAATTEGWKTIKPVTRPLMFCKMVTYSGAPGGYSAGSAPQFPTNTNPIKWEFAQTFNPLGPDNVSYISFDPTNNYPKLKKGIYDLKFQMSIDPSASGAFPNYHWFQTWFGINASSGYILGDNPGGGVPGGAGVVITQAEAVFGSSVQWAVTHHTTLVIHGTPAIDANITCHVTPASGPSAEPIAANLLITRLGDID